MRENVTRSNTKQHCSVCAHNDYTRNSIGYIIFCIGTIYIYASARGFYIRNIIKFVIRLKYLQYRDI